MKKDQKGRAMRKEEKNYLEEYTTSGGLHLRHAIDPAPEDRYFKMHVHNECEIFCFLAGYSEYLVEGARYPLERGSVLIMRPSESHRTRILRSGRYERFTMNFPVNAMDALDPQRRLLRPFLDRPLGVGNLYRPGELQGADALHLFEHLFGIADPYERQMQANLTLAALLRSVNEAFERRSGDLTPLQTLAGQILAYINAHLFEELSIDLLAEHFFISRSQVGRLVREATGSSPWKYITLKRVTAARELIRSGVSVSDAANRCGFGDYSAFYRTYVSCFGCSPREDRT